MKVNQFINSKGKHIKNHFIIADDEGTKEYLQSYNSKVVEYHKNKRLIVIGRDYNFCMATARNVYDYLQQITGLGVGATTLRRALQSGNLGDFMVIFMDNLF